MLYSAACGAFAEVFFGSCEFLGTILQSHLVIIPGPLLAIVTRSVLMKLPGDVRYSTYGCRR